MCNIEKPYISVCYNIFVGFKAFMAAMRADNQREHPAVYKNKGYNGLEGALRLAKQGDFRGRIEQAPGQYGLYD